MIDAAFRVRCWENEPIRPDDERDEYFRDKARIIHSAAFRRLQAKTQVMGVGEGDYHRTRLTHSIEAAQIGEGIVERLSKKYAEGTEIQHWLPSRDLIAAACYAHDLGHPPFGHGGERALHRKMAKHGGFEGNGQTLRILTRLEKYKPHKGMNPTHRLLLAVLKYPVPHSAFPQEENPKKPPKCYFDTEAEIVDRILAAHFTVGEGQAFRDGRDLDGKPNQHTLDCSIMEYADDIAYGVHDLEDVVARHLVDRDEIFGGLKAVFAGRTTIGVGEKGVSLRDFEDHLFEKSWERKALIGKLVNLFVTSIEIRPVNGYAHPLLRYRATLDRPIEDLLKKLKSLTYDLVVKRANVQQLEFRGQKVVEKLFDAFIDDPEKLIPKNAWISLSDKDSRERRVCDYIAGMTDPFAERIYHRLYTPGIGSSHDEL